MEELKLLGSRGTMTLKRMHIVCKQLSTVRIFILMESHSCFIRSLDLHSYGMFGHFFDG